MKSIDFKSLLIGILGTALVMMLMGKSVFQPEPYQIQCVHLEDTIGMGYVACRLFDMNNISKQIKSWWGQDCSFVIKMASRMRFYVV